MIKDYPFDMDHLRPIRFSPKYYDNNASSKNLQNGISHFHLKTSILNCDTCGVNDADISVPLNNMNGTLMIVGNQAEDIHFDSKQGEVLAYVLKQLHMNFNELYLTSIKKTNQHKEVCHKHITSEVIVINPLLIVCLGEEAGNHISGMQTSPGMTLTLPNGSDLVVSQSLEDLLENMELYQSFYNHIEVAINQWGYRYNQRRI